MATYSLPPILGYSYPAFVNSVLLPIEYPIDFNTRPGTNVRFEYKIIHNESNELKTGFSTTQYVNGDQFWPVAITIPANEFSSAGIYKIQLRFYVSADDYSEWSSICYTKKLSKAPEVEISELNYEGDTTPCIVQDSPTFTGIYKSEEEEPLEYRFSLYYATNDYNLISTTGWKKHISGQNYHYGRFPVLLENHHNYNIIYEVKTVNNFQPTLSIARAFRTDFFHIQDDIGLSITSGKDYDNGVVNVQIKSNQVFAGNLMLRRASEKTNYQNWEDLQYLQILNEQPSISYNDFTVEHGVRYRYGIQVIDQENGVESRSNLMKSRDRDTNELYTMAEFEDIFLVSNNEQIKIKFNPKVSNLKRNLLEQKQDTIGNQYPYIMKNGHSNYFSFSLGGLISYFADAKNSVLFRNKTQANEKEMDLLNERTTNLTDRNIYNERQYREKIERFLTNGEAKLFKSPTEGNILVYLMQVSLTPNDILGRMIYSFTSTAYEIGAITDTETLLKHKIFNKGQWIAVENMPSVLRPIDSGYAQSRARAANSNYRRLAVISGENIIDTLNDILKTENANNPCTPRIINFQSISIFAVDKNMKLKINESENDQIFEITVEEGLELPQGCLQIDSIVSKEDGYIDIQGLAIQKFESNIVYTRTATIDPRMVSITNIGQCITTIQEDFDLVAWATIHYRLEKFASFSYLKLRAYPGKEFTVTVDGNDYEVYSNQDRYFTEQIRECSIKLPEGVNEIGFYADFIYNGYIYK